MPWCHWRGLQCWVRGPGTIVEVGVQLFTEVSRMQGRPWSLDLYTGIFMVVEWIRGGGTRCSMVGGDTAWGLGTILRFGARNGAPG